MNVSTTGFSRRTVQLLMVAFIGLWVMPTIAGALTPKDRQQIIEVVQAQLNAFARDDAAEAFSYAAPNIKQMVGSAENFMEMVRTRFHMVYSPSSTTFMQPSGDAEDAVLDVQMTDEEGDAWEATYSLQRQGKSTWRITGCTVAEATGTIV